MTMRIVRTAMLSSGLLAAIVLGVPALALTALGVLGRAWYFPGDPPYFDLAVVPAALGAVFGAAIWRLGRPGGTAGGGRQSVRSWSFVGAIVCCACSLSLLVGVCGIAYRQAPAWREVRRGIRTYGDAIAADVGDRKTVLTPEAFLALRGKHLAEPIAVRLPGFGTVHLRVAHGVYPYVGVDFGKGQNALFEPTTMLCIYSD